MNPDFVVDALAVGARGFVAESSFPAKFVKAVRAVDQGMAWAPRSAIAGFIERSTPVSRGIWPNSGLTDRQKEVLATLMEGKANKQIAVELSIRTHTVKAHVAKLMKKSRLRTVPSSLFVRLTTISCQTALELESQPTNGSAGLLTGSVLINVASALSAPATVRSTPSHFGSLRAS